jgi:PIN domain nuclease of toxin-antitoxin system
VSYLADTHVLLWAVREPERVSSLARSVLEDGSQVVYFSIASIWEIAIKQSLGKLKLDATVREFVQAQIHNDFKLLPVDVEHIARTATLPLHHRDPFDRMLIAQAEVEDLQIITMDASFSQYDVRCVW